MTSGTPTEPKPDVTVTPAAPAPATRPSVLTPLSILTLAGVLLFTHLHAPPAAAPHDHAINGVALGKAYAPTLAGTYADAWVAAARALEEGKAVADAQKAMQDTWQAERIAAFKKDVEPGFSLVLPAGTEPTDAARRAEVVRLWRDFAKGLKGGH